MKNELLAIYLVDISGSMQNCHGDVIGGLNQLIEDQVKSDIPVRTSIFEFDTNYAVVVNNLPSKEVRKFTRADFVPRGGTALYDALARTIDDTGRALAVMPESERPSKVLVHVFSDGGENSSREYSLSAGGGERLKAKVEHQRNVYSWEFVFIGMDFNPSKVAADLGFAACNVVSTPKCNVAGTMRAVTSNRYAYSTGKSSNMSEAYATETANQVTT